MAAATGAMPALLSYQYAKGNAFKYTDRRGLQEIETEPSGPYETWSNTMDPYVSLIEQTDSQWVEAQEEQQEEIQQLNNALAAKLGMPTQPLACYGSLIKRANLFHKNLPMTRLPRLL